MPSSARLSLRFARTDVRQAHRRWSQRIATHLQRGLGHHGLEAIAVHRFDERRQLHGRCAAPRGCRRDRTQSARSRIGPAATCAITEMMPTAPTEQERQEQAVIARIPGQTGFHTLAHGARDVSGGVLDGLDVVEFGQTAVGFQLDVQSGTAQAHRKR